MAALNAAAVTKLVSDRGHVYTAELVLNFSDLVGKSGTAIKGIWLPPGAILTKVGFLAIVAFNSATSDTLSIQRESDSSVVLAATSIATLNARAVAAEAALGGVSVGDYLDFTWTGVGAIPTAGQVRICAHYELQGHSELNHGKDGVPPGLS